MGNIKSLLVGVSFYDDPETKNLPCGVGDIALIKEAIVEGFNTQEENVVSIGEQGVATFDKFVEGLCNLKKITTPNDTVIFYFSGHGDISKDNNLHYLCFSDKSCATQEVLAYFDGLEAKNKIIVMDCCHSGHFDIIHTPNTFDETVLPYIGTGYAVFAACRSEEKS